MSYDSIVCGWFHDKDTCGNDPRYSGNIDDEVGFMGGKGRGICSASAKAFHQIGVTVSINSG